MARKKNINFDFGLTDIKGWFKDVLFRILTVGVVCIVIGSVLLLVPDILKLFPELKGFAGNLIKAGILVSVMAVIILKYKIIFPNIFKLLKNIVLRSKNTEFPKMEKEKIKIKKSKENIYLKSILPLMDSCPPKQNIGKAELEDDLNRCLNHIDVLKATNSENMPRLTVLGIKGSFGANIITINTETVRGLTLNTLKGKKDEIENFLGWKGLRFERGDDIGHVKIIVPLKERQRILTRDMLEMQEYQDIPNEDYPMPVGMTLEGNPIYVKLSNPITPHILIGGATGSGKSFLVNSMIFTLLNTYSPKELLVYIIDPKGAEFINFKDFSHVIQYVDNDFEKQSKVVSLVENEMNRRNIEVFAPKGVKNFSQWNSRYKDKALPRILLIIDEYADIVTDKEQRKVFEPIVMRLAAKARSTGIHLMLLTQKPSVETINSTLRSNLGCRIAMLMMDTNSYRTMLSSYDGTVLAGNGDMIVEFADKVYRLQGSCLTTAGEEREEVLIKKCINFWNKEGFKEQHSVDLSKVEVNSADNDIPLEEEDSIDDVPKEEKIIKTPLISKEFFNLKEDMDEVEKLLRISICSVVLDSDDNSEEKFLPSQRYIEEHYDLKKYKVQKFIDNLKNDGWIKKIDSNNPKFDRFKIILDKELALKWLEAIKLD